jgi:hypothetical protein
MSLQDDLLPWRLPTVVCLDNGNKVVAFSIPEEVFERIEPELMAVKSVYEKRPPKESVPDGSRL